MGRPSLSVQYSDDTFNRLFDFFMANPSLTVKDVADRSKEVCGVAVKYVDLREVARRADWAVKRSQFQEAVNTSAVSDDDNVVSEVNHIRRIIYRQITAASEAGVMITGEGADYDTIKEALAGIPDIKVVKLRPGGVDAQMVNAYMNLLSKSNVKLDLGGNVSGKTAREQALELTGEADKELNDYYQSLAPSS